ncbi:MAG: DUF2637 domain-containing protein [Chloroflexota bacterium]
MNSVARRTAYVLSIGTVTGVAALASYEHQVDVATLAHQAALLAHTLPLSIDGMLLVATLAMSEDKANGRKPRGWARFGFWFGAAVSTAANIASTVVHYGDWLSIAWSMVAPIVLLIVVEIMARPGKPKPVAVPVKVPASPVRVAPEPVVERAEQIVHAEVTRLPAPVSPAPQQSSTDRRVSTRSGPLVGREVVSPLTGRILTERPPKV